MKIGLVSLGCPKNLVDSEVMLGLAHDAGHELTNVASEADVLVVNTCAFIDSAKQESIDTILEMARHKTDGACRRLIVTGCLAERYREELQTEIQGLGEKTIRKVDYWMNTYQFLKSTGALQAKMEEMEKKIQG